MDYVRPFGMEEYPINSADNVNCDPLKNEIGGNHYKSSYQPIELMEKVRMYACCSFILKYIFRHKNKGKKQDLEKALHCCELMEKLGKNWYDGTTVNSYDTDNSLYEFNRFVQDNGQLDSNQIRAIFAICAKDLYSLKMSINNEIKEYYS